MPDSFDGLCSLWSGADPREWDEGYVSPLPGRFQLYHKVAIASKFEIDSIFIKKLNVFDPFLQVLIREKLCFLQLQQNFRNNSILNSSKYYEDTTQCMQL